MVPADTGLKISDKGEIELDSPKSSALVGTDANGKLVDATYDYITFDDIYPIGSIYISVGDTLPTYFSQHGTWKKISDGKSIWTTSDTDELGHVIKGSLPNITGSLTAHLQNYYDIAATGAFSSSTLEKGLKSTSTTDSETATYALDASKSNTVYSAEAGESIVRPTSVGVSMWKRVAPGSLVTVTFKDSDKSTIIDVVEVDKGTLFSEIEKPSVTSTVGRKHTGWSIDDSKVINDNTTAIATYSIFKFSDVTIAGIGGGVAYTLDKSQWSFDSSSWTWTISSPHLLHHKLRVTIGY